MAGHSHSANIARRKNAVDAKRGKDFSKLSRAIISAARQGGPDPDQNLKLKYAIEKAKAGNMPKDTIERAVARGSGAKDGDDYEELTYEGYAPGGIALLICCLTDNRKRTAPDIKYIFDRANGNLGAQGSVAFMFDQRSVFVVEAGERDEDALMELALEVGVDDVEVDGDVAVFYADAREFISTKAALEAAGLKFLSAELAYVPQNRITLETKADAAKVLKLIASLEENEDVQSVYANYDMPPEWVDELS